MGKSKTAKYKIGQRLIHRRVKWVCTITNIGKPMDTIIYEVAHPNGRKILHSLNELEKIYWTSDAAQVLYAHS